MEFDKIKAQVKKLGVDITRMDNENYFEVVICRARLEEMVSVLEGIFGAPVRQSDNKIPKDAENLIKKAGGLRKGQTLYLLNDKSKYSAFAMLWPWRVHG